ncbi:hypothetical protein F2Q68_00019846 [Brassica cretica]|uniref:Uncharacterized protein n=2 Tax=Brassica cretica TaxID=69181 RepID=A0A3N6RRB8_BRACR|nr:hypothetical protein F2Q68_00019846 [Brassica cretica]KAF3568216.1 hypothetical protein DY000_02012969 [Brassica cretica]
MIIELSNFISLQLLSKKRNPFRRSPCSGDCRVLRAVVRSSEPPALVSPCSSLCISVVSGRVTRSSSRFRSGAPSVDLEGFGVVGGARGRRCLIVPLSSSCLELQSGWAPSSPHGGSGGSALRYSCSLTVVVGSLDLFRMAIGSRVTNSPDRTTPEVVYLSSPIVLYGLLVKWVYTVPVDGLEGGNLRERLLNDGIAGLCHCLVR